MARFFSETACQLKAIEDIKRDMEFDILLSTSIIESGLDMPFVNTIIINNAQAFGLADLYQLRGRVGRTDKSAYCYLLYPKNLPLKEEQKKRLSALYEFAELGSGMRLAMSDLEIRGAGNILGEEQSGNIKIFLNFCKFM